MRLFWKLFWALTTAFLAIAAVSSWLGHQWLASSQHAASRLELLEQLGDEAPRFYLEGGPRMLGRWLRRTGRRHHARLFLLDARGVNLLPHPLPPELEAFVRRAIKDPSPRRHIHPPFIASIRPITVEGRRFFWLAATRLPPEAVRESRRQVLLLRAVLSLAAILLLSWALSRMFVRPILGLRHAATRLGEGDLHARLPQELTRRRDELGELARAFNRMAERIERLIESQRRLLRDISHELRSPLARLQAALELARRAPEGHGREELARIEREAQRLDDLIGEVLAMSRLEHESPTDHAEPVDMVALLREVAADAAFEAEAHGKRLRYALEAERAVVRGNRKWLARALDNVLRNAIRHTHEGTAVEVAARLRDERLTIEVRDHGDGVDERALARLFEPFYRAEGAGRQGHGLGLAIARRVVEAHGGRIEAANAPDGGLVVRIDLPLTRP